MRKVSIVAIVMGIVFIFLSSLIPLLNDKMSVEGCLIIGSIYMFGGAILHYLPTSKEDK